MNQINNAEESPGHLAILTGGRGNTLKKAIGIKEVQTCTLKQSQSQWSSFGRT